jgi:hypothetical protein
MTKKFTYTEAELQELLDGINTETGIFYDSIGEAAETIGLSISKLSNRLSGWAKNKTSFAYA